MSARHLPQVTRRPGYRRTVCPCFTPNGLSPDSPPRTRVFFACDLSASAGHVGQREQTLEVLGGLFGKALNGFTAQHRQVIGHITHVFRQVRLAAMGNRRQVRRIGFHQQAVGRHLARHVAQGVGVAEGDDARQGDIEAQVQRGLGHVPVFGEAMQHAGLGQGRFAQQRKGVSAGASGVDDHRFAGLLGRLQVQAEGGLLQLGGFRLVVVIQAGFANRHHAWVVELAQEPIQGRRFTGLEVQRVNTDRAVDIGIAISQGFDVGGVVGAHADAQEVPYPTLACRFQGGIEGAAVLGKVEAIKVAVGIYEHRKVRLNSWEVSGRRYTRRPLKLTPAEQADPLHQQCFEQQHAVEVGLAEDFLALGQDPVLNVQHLVLRTFLRQVLHHFTHIRQAQAVFVLGQLVAQDQARPVTEPVEQQQQRNILPGAFGQLRGGLFLFEQLLDAVHHQRALLTHALGLQLHRCQG
ncbi:hypothetical protein ALP97_05217 [Pseudomonas salomonii]|uniref:Uncharacterized protein n=1 Tax=Pseudomonas salomonii TaxID=191391 RepID=A0A3M4Q1A1_9PSED|nr:hypothetical protein ALP97_05217 [Pseudomonas salomonii]